MTIWACCAPSCRVEWRCRPTGRRPNSKHIQNMKHSISFAELCPAESPDFAEHLLYSINVIASRAAADAQAMTGSEDTPVFSHLDETGISFSAEPLEAAPCAAPIFTVPRNLPLKNRGIRLDNALGDFQYKAWLIRLRNALIESELQQQLPLPPAICDELRWRHLCLRVDNLTMICTLAAPVRLPYRVALWLPQGEGGQRLTTDDWDAAELGELWTEEPPLHDVRRPADDLPRLLSASSIVNATCTISPPRARWLFPLDHS